MFGTILCLVILGITFTLFGKMSLNDPDFQDIAVTRSDKIWFGIYLAVFAVIIIRLPIYPKLYASIALPLLLISAYTDKKVKLLYNMVFYILVPVAIILSTVQSSIRIQPTGPEFSFQLCLQTLSVIIFAVILEVFGMYGNGDKGMAIVCGCTWYLLRPDYGSVESLLMECIILLIAEVIFYARAIIEKNLDGPIKLKESRPLGPDLLFATTLVLIGGTFI